jgi:WD40 repeat protein
MKQYLKHLITFSGMVVIVMAHALSAQGQKYSDWSAPVNLGPVVNSTSSDSQMAISKNGLSLYLTSGRAGGLGSVDLYVSQRASVDDPWGTPVNLGPTINSTSGEANPVFSRDEHTMYFQSDRPGGLGSIDIWVSHREHTHDDFDWQPPVNLAEINSTASDNAPAYFENEEDGLPQLYFASDRPGGAGGLDIYVSEQTTDGSFGTPVRVAELNSTGGDTRPTIRHDGLEIFIQSNRAGTIGLADLWVSTRENTLDAWSNPVNLGNTVNTTFNEQNPFLSSDGKTLFFTSDRPGGIGSTDIHMTTRTKRRGNGE